MEVFRRKEAHANLHFRGVMLTTGLRIDCKAKTKAWRLVRDLLQYFKGQMTVA